MCEALTGVLFVFPSLRLPSSMALKRNATLTPVKCHISWLRASLSYSLAEKSSQPAHNVSSASCKSVHHIPCSMDFSHHPMVSMMVSILLSVPNRTCTWYAPPWSIEIVCEQISLTLVMPWECPLGFQSVFLLHLSLFWSMGKLRPVHLPHTVLSTIYRKLGERVQLGFLLLPLLVSNHILLHNCGLVPHRYHCQVLVNVLGCNH